MVSTYLVPHETNGTSIRALRTRIPYLRKEKGQKAEDNFVNTFQKKEIPEKIEEVKVKMGELLSEVLVKNKILSSKSEWRRLVLSKAIHDLSKTQNITDINLKISENLTLKIGKKKFIKVLVN